MACFNLIVDDPEPGATSRGIAIGILAEVIRLQAQLRIADLQLHQRVLDSELSSTRKSRLRLLEAEKEQLLAHEQELVHIAEFAEDAAVPAFGALLDLVGGPVQALEFGNRVVGARLPISREQVLMIVRVVLLPQSNKRTRLCMQRVDPQRGYAPTQPLAPRCFGEIGDAYIDDALDSMRLDSLFLTALAYLAMN